MNLEKHVLKCYLKPLRDALLPRLLSGELQVPGAVKLLEAII